MGRDKHGDVTGAPTQLFRTSLKRNVLESTSKGDSRWTYRGSATVKQKVSTPLVSHTLAMLPEHVLMFHPGHCFIIDVQPDIPCVTVTIRVKNVDCIVPVACRFAVMVENSIKLVTRWL
jgi:hypothetical protein